MGIPVYFRENDPSIKACCLQAVGGIVAPLIGVNDQRLRGRHPNSFDIITKPSIHYLKKIDALPAEPRADFNFKQ